jgi:hypothetical protein
MRRAQGKSFGYVLVPLYVEQSRGETIEEAVTRSSYDEVWNVLNRLQEHDDLLAQIIGDMRIQRGETGGFDDSRFRERVEILGPSLPLDQLRSSITAACLDAVGDPWFERYGQLLAYKQAHGNCDLSARWSENQKLATWVVNQRVLQRDGVLEPEKVELLNRIGFKWNPFASNWRTNYLALLEYRKRFGHCRVPQDWTGNRKLAQWVKTQRMEYGRGELDRERRALLEKIGFEWASALGTWDERFAELCAFQKRFNHTLVPVKWPENPLLGRWASGQRYKRKRGKLRKESEDRLNSIGFAWDARPVVTQIARTPTDPDKQWRAMFDLFKAHAAVHGVATVQVIDQDTAKLNRWMLSQRRAKKEGNLREARIQALDEIGFVWRRNLRRASERDSSPFKATTLFRSWNEMFGELIDFFKLHGHCNVLSDWAAKPELAHWVAQQRKAKRENRLTPEQAGRMEEIGFAWDTHDGDWDAMFARLVEHLRPMHNGKPRDSVLSDELRRWIMTQRRLKKLRELNPERERRLNAIDFEWEPFSAQWAVMLSRLRTYNAEHGNSRVPSKWPNDPQLASWVGTQRMRKTQGRLSIERIAKLEAVGFEWSPGRGGGHPGREAWEQMFTQLQAFYATHQHSNVPQIFPSNQKLGWWVTTQRRKFRKRKPTETEVTRLNELGFQWEVSSKGGRPRAQSPAPSDRQKPPSINQEWELMFQMLQQHKQTHGDCLVPQRWKKNRKLAEWVSRQRMAYNLGRLDAVRVQRLAELGFDWDPAGTRWNEMFQELIEFKKERGHTNVPQRSPKYTQLASWVHNQRAAKRDKRPIIAERGKRLDEIGFVWRIVEPTSWEAMFELLVEFQKDHGHCNVPQKYPRNRRFGRWVNTQRLRFKHRKLPIERERRLEKLGFVWNMKPGVSEKRDEKSQAVQSGS